MNAEIILTCALCDQVFTPDFRYECRPKDSGGIGICQRCEVPQYTGAIKDEIGKKAYKQIRTQYILKYANLRT